MIKKTIVISDVHGCITEFRELLYLVDYKSTNVRVILVGDILDRGEDSVGCIRLARESGIESVLGNHEKKYLKWFHNSTNKNNVYDHRPHYSQFNDDDTNYMFRMPLYIEIPEQKALIVHAGLRPGVPLEKQTKDDLCYIRYMDDDKKFVSLRKINSMGSVEAAKAHFWTEHGPFGYDKIVYGHNVHSFTDIKIDKYDDGSACYGIDTGCVFSGNLTSFCIEDLSIIQVKAKREYYKSNFNIR